MFGEIDHIGVAVEDLDATLAVYNEKFEMAIQYREVVESQGVEAVLLEVGGGHVELLKPLGPDTPVGKFIEKRGTGMHHVAYRVTDVQAELDRLGALGVELIDETPRIGIRKSTVAFIHPQAAGGVLTELVTPADDH
ncbi:MAG: methylmalonyl-CoA epimerase [Solirubrobacterales bacterium]